MINLNKESIYLEHYPTGKTQNIVIKVGRKILMMDFACIGGICRVDIYARKGKVRNKYSKYSTGIGSFKCYKKSVITRKIVESAAEIEKAQRLLDGFHLSGDYHEG